MSWLGGELAIGDKEMCELHSQALLIPVFHIQERRVHTEERSGLIELSSTLPCRPRVPPVTCNETETESCEAKQSTKPWSGSTCQCKNANEPRAGLKRLPGNADPCTKDTSCY